MDWLEAVVHTTTMGADIVSEVLMNAGAIGTAIEDRYDVTSSKKSDGMWDMIDEDVLKHMSEDVLVKAYFKSDASAPETLHLVEQKLGEIAKMDMGFDMGSLTLDTQGVREQDWAENWKKYYKPFRAGERLVIKPSWEAYEPKAGDLVLELDPAWRSARARTRRRSCAWNSLKNTSRPDAARLTWDAEAAFSAWRRPSSARPTCWRLIWTSWR